MKLIYNYKDHYTNIFQLECRKMANREISLPTGTSKIQMKVSVKPRATYRICLKARNVNGNGVIFCNFFGGMKHDFYHHKLCIDSKQMKEYIINTDTPDFPDRFPILFRVWKDKKVSSGNVVVGDVKIYKLADKIDMTKTPKLSIVIPIFNQKFVTKRCLDSIINRTTKVPYEIIIVNNGSTDGTLQLLKEEFVGIRIINNKQNLGFAKACNQGILKARGEYILLLNNDTKVVQNDWCDGMIEMLQHVDITGATGGLLDLNTCRYLREITLNSNVYHYIAGWCMMFKKSLIDKVGLLTEEFGIGLFEDTAFCINAREKKYKIAITEDVPVFHYGHATIKNLQFEKLYAKNREIFLKKYGKRLAKLEEQNEQNIPKIINRLIRPKSQKKAGGFIPGKVSIITLNYNGIEMLQKAIPSVMKNTYYPSFEWIISDNGSKDGSVKYIKEQMKKFPNIIMFDRKTNVGNFASINNELADVADGEYLLFLNNDIEAKPKWLTEMMRIMRSDSSVSIVGSLLYYPHGKIQHAGVFFDHRGYPGNFCYLNMPRLQNSKTFHKVDREYNAVTGACLLMRHEDFLAVDKFCEKFDYCFEDVDLCLTAKRKLGKKVVFCASSILTHYEGVTTRKIHKRISFQKNITTLLKKWRYKIPKDYEIFRKNSKKGIYSTEKISAKDMYAELGFNVVVCIDDREIYKKYLKRSLVNHFSMPIYLVEINNIGNKYTSMAQALNEHMVDLPYNQTLIIHQDVEFSPGFDLELLLKMYKLKNPGIVGLAGVTLDDVPVGRLKEADEEIWNDQAIASGPVPIVDECCFAFFNKHDFKFDEETFTSFHFYGADLCLQALSRGLNNYVVDIPTTHYSDKGKRSIEKTTKDVFKQEMKKLKKKWQDKHPVIRTTTVRLTEEKNIIYTEIG